MFGLQCGLVAGGLRTLFHHWRLRRRRGALVPGCGDHAVLTAVHKIMRDEQLQPEKSVAVSGIGCSSRLPHYMGTYGFHGLHGRALPIACGVKSRRPDLDVWVATGDGDCFSIGTAHWIHAMRYNMDMTLLVFDNGVYGLTKAQTSPTSPVGFKTNTHPFGAILPPLNPLTVTLGITNISFVAQVSGLESAAAVRDHKSRPPAQGDRFRAHHPALSRIRRGARQGNAERPFAVPDTST